jgi:hypothetical protein
MPSNPTPTYAAAQMREFAALHERDDSHNTAAMLRDGADAMETLEEILDAFDALPGTYFIHDLDSLHALLCAALAAREGKEAQP